MRIVVHARAGAKLSKIEPLAGSDTVLKIWVREPAEGGKANYAIVKALAAYFKVPAAQVVLTSGAAAKIKRFRIGA